MDLANTKGLKLAVLYRQTRRTTTSENLTSLTRKRLPFSDMLLICLHPLVFLPAGLVIYHSNPESHLIMVPTRTLFLSRSEGLYHAEGASSRFMVASGGVLSEGYGHDGSGVCLGDGQTEAERVPSQGGRGDALLRCMLPHQTYLPE